MTLPKFALYWARQLGVPCASLVQLRGGINGRVYQCGAGTARYVIKGYPPGIAGYPDRMQAEVEFLNFAAEVAPQYVPRLLQADPDLRAVVLEHLDGATYPEGVPPPSNDIASAVDFFRRINLDRRAAQQQVRLDAAEGFLRLSEHVNNVHERLAAMRTEHLPRGTQANARQLLSRVKSASERVALKTDTLIASGIVEDSIDPDQRCVSPSDFGFHNAIRTAAGVKFFDFEFAGWDDPAKAAADFVLQPRVPTGSRSSPLLHVIDDNQAQERDKRCAVLGPVLRLKWVCIMLAVLQPSRLEQLLAAIPESDPVTLTQQRLSLAVTYLEEESPFGLH